MNGINFYLNKADAEKIPYSAIDDWFNGSGW
jgi:hypothetical protein